METVIADT